MKTIAHLFPRVLTGIILKLRTFTQAPEQLRVGSAIHRGEDEAASEDSQSVATRSHSSLLLPFHTPRVGLLVISEVIIITMIIIHSFIHSKLTVQCCAGTYFLFFSYDDLCFVVLLRLYYFPEALCAVGRHCL